MNREKQKFCSIFSNAIADGLNTLENKEGGKREHELGDMESIVVAVPYTLQARTEYFDENEDEAEAHIEETLDEILLEGEKANVVYNSLDWKSEFKELYTKLDEDSARSICSKLEEKIDEKSGMVSIVGVKKVDKLRINTNNHKDANFVIVIMLKKEKVGYKEIVEYVLLQLMDKIAADTEMENLENIKENLQPFRKNWYLMGGYAEYYLKKNDLPLAERIIELSASRYEGSESEARIYFTKNQLDSSSGMQFPLEEERIIQPQKARMIRKLMELSKRNAIYLYAQKRKEEFVVTDLVQVKSDKKDENTESNSISNKKCDTYIKFSGFLCWSVVVGERETLTYRNGRYEVNYSEKNREYMHKIEELEGFVGNETTKMLNALVKLLAKQKHGTIAIVSDYEGNKDSEIKRFCETNRAVRLDTEFKRTKNAEDEMNWNEEQILSLTCIDGALFMDLDGNCFAFSVLLDGKAEIKGDVGRGARYNSVVNYIKQKKRGKYIGIIVSEDGMINIVSNACQFG